MSGAGADAPRREPPPAHPRLRPRDLAAGPAGSRLEDLDGGRDLIMTYNGRGALFHLFRHLAGAGKRRVLLPAFHCPTVVDPALRAGLEPRYYRIGRDLSLDEADAESRLDAETAAVVVINYLGFPARMDSLRAAARSLQVPVVEDCSHSFLQAGPLGLTGERGDFATFSFWKLLALGVGGGIRVADPARRFSPDFTREPAAEALRRTKTLLRPLLDELAAVRFAQRARTRLRGAGRHLAQTTPEPTGGATPMRFEYPFDEKLASARIPKAVDLLLRRADLSEIASRRRANYRALVEMLPRSPLIAPLWPDLPEHVVPWACPVLVGRRAAHDVRLRARGVPLFTFGETLHRSLFELCDEPALDDARFLADNLLCLSIHQELSEARIRDAGRIIVDYLDEHAQHHG